MAWGEQTRRSFYTSRYGEEDGMRRFAEWQDAQQQKQYENDPQPQAGAVWVEDENFQPVKPKRRTTTRRKPATPIEQSPEVTTSYELIIAVADQTAAQINPLWAQVPRLTGGDAIIERYLAELFQSDQPEVERLAAVLADVGKENKWIAALYQMVKKHGKKAGPWLKLLTVCGSIFVPRLIAIGVIPNIFGGGNDGTDMEGGGTHGDRGNDGQRQVSPDELSTRSMPEEIYRAQKQSGFSQVPAGANGAYGTTDLPSQREPLGSSTGL